MLNLIQYFFLINVGDALINMQGNHTLIGRAALLALIEIPCCVTNNAVLLTMKFRALLLML